MTGNVKQNNWLKYAEKQIKSNTTDQRSSFIITPSPDPAKGCNKQFVSTYACDPNTTLKTISIDAPADGKAAVYDCSTEYNQCLDGKLTIGDEGNVTFQKSDGTLIWQSGTNTVGIALDQYKAVNSKYGRNYLLSGEFLLPDEFVGSPSGNCALICQSESKNKYSLDIIYFQISCNKQGEPSSGKGEYGDVTDLKKVQAAYSMSKGVQSNKNANLVTYSDNNINSLNYKSKNINYDNDLQYKYGEYGKNKCPSGYEPVNKIDCKNAGKSKEGSKLRYRGTIANGDDMGGCFIGPQIWEKGCWGGGRLFGVKIPIAGDCKQDVQYNTRSGKNTSLGTLEASAAAVTVGAEEGGTAVAEELAEAAATNPELAEQLGTAAVATEVGSQVTAGLAAGVAALGSVFDDQQSHQRLLCQKKNVNSDNVYISIGNYDLDADNLMTMKNSDIDSCKKKCNELQECGGYIFDNSNQKCKLREFKNLYPENTTRISDPNSEMFLRQLSVNNPTSCSNKLDSTFGDVYSKLKTGPGMNATTLCGLAEFTKNQRKQVLNAEKQLNTARNQLFSDSTSLNTTNQKLDKNMLTSISKQNSDLKSYDQIKKKSQIANNNLVDIGGMQEDANLEMVSKNIQNTVWTAALIIAVVMAIKLSR